MKNQSNNQRIFGGCHADGTLQPARTIQTQTAITPAAHHPQVSESSSDSPSNDSTVKPAQDNSSEAASSSKHAAASNDSKDSSVKEDWKVEFEKSLMEQYGLKPHHYVDLGNGIYEVYVEREGKFISYLQKMLHTSNPDIPNHRLLRFQDILCMVSLDNNS